MRSHNLIPLETVKTESQVWREELTSGRTGILAAIIGLFKRNGRTVERDRGERRAA
jgi:hypothetical protein